MQLTVEGITDGGDFPEPFAMGVKDPEQHATMGRNINPAVRWSDVPEGTKSLVLICVDTDAPTRPDDVNQEGRTVPADLPRADFYHWVMVDIQPTVQGIDEGACCDGVTPRGKKDPAGPEGARQGLNDYTGWFDGDPDMGGEYYGYDGPFPPWNDSLPHHYRFRLYATDLERCPVDGAFTGAEVEEALQGHILDQVEVVGLYSLNPDVA